MADFNIDPTSQQYIALLNGIGVLRDVMTPRLVVFKKLYFNNPTKAKLWIQNDPLLKATLKFLKDGGEYIEKLQSGELDT